MTEWDKGINENTRKSKKKVEQALNNWNYKTVIWKKFLNMV